MKNLDASFRALRVLHTAKDLFKQYGFHKVGVDQIIAESQINKGTFLATFTPKKDLLNGVWSRKKSSYKKK